jgi:hypothetical protein
MDNQTQMPEYVTKLPQAVQDFVYDGAWEERTTEIAKKYSLGPGQTDALANIVVLVLIGLEKPETFLDTIIADVGISRLLAEQIMEDIEKRVFEYALKEIENKNLSKTTFDVKFPQAKNSNVPEIKPTILPMVEKGEVAHDNSQNNPIIKPVSKPIPQQFTGPLILNPIGPVKSSIESEPVQRPVPVPRFIPPITESPSTHQGQPIEGRSKNDEVRNEMESKTPEIPKATPTPQNFMDAKLNSVVSGVSEKPAQTEKPPQTPPPKTYAADPYREPLN